MRQATGALAAVVLIACNGVAPAPPGASKDAALPSDDATGLDVPTPGSDADAKDSNRGGDATGSSQEASIPTDDAGIPQQVPMACDLDASDEASADYCPPPFSVCVDGHNLAYFDWGACVAGWCQWPHKVMVCPAAGACINGACISTATAQAPN